MKELRFSLEFNSPAFLSGAPVYRDGPNGIPHYPADPRGIRIPSLRGVLEFWYRALHGSFPSEQVYREQARVFGSAEGGQGLSIRPVGRVSVEGKVLEFGGKGESPFPFLYLGYGPLQLVSLSKNEQIATSYHKKQTRDAICPGTDKRGRFQFIARGNDFQIQALKRSLILLHLFGGLGSRSRRGWGSVEVGAKDEAAFASPTGSKEPADWVLATLGLAWSQASHPPDAGQPEFSALSRDTRIYVTKVYPGDYRAVLEEFYRRFNEIRSYRDKRQLARADHDLELSDLGLDRSLSITAVPARLAFGMPYQPGHPGVWSMKYIGRLSGPQKTGDKVVTRRSSPLLLKVVRLGANRHAGVALFLPSRFFGNPGFEIGAEGKDVTQPFPGYGAVETFLSGSGWTRVPLP